MVHGDIKMFDGVAICCYLLHQFDKGRNSSDILFFFFFLLSLYLLATHHENISSFWPTIQHLRVYSTNCPFIALVRPLHLSSICSLSGTVDNLTASSSPVQMVVEVTSWLFSWLFDARVSHLVQSPSHLGWLWPQGLERSLRTSIEYECASVRVPDFHYLGSILGEKQYFFGDQFTAIDVCFADDSILNCRLSSAWIAWHSTLRRPAGLTNFQTSLRTSAKESKTVLPSSLQPHQHYESIRRNHPLSCDRLMWCQPECPFFIIIHAICVMQSK